MAMKVQNLATLNLSDAIYEAIDGAFTTIEGHFEGLITLDLEQKARIVRLGPEYEAFTRETLDVLEQYPQILPAGMSVSDARADLLARDRLRPRLLRLAQLLQRLQDTELALGSDALALALHGYRLLQVSGRAAGLQVRQKELGTHFAGRGKRKAKTQTGGTVPVA
jgi:hypothetical protein